MTSNYAPDGLYPNGLQRARFLPAIEVLKRELDVVGLGGGTDHRRRILEGYRVWYSPPGEDADQHLALFFEAMTKASFESNGTLELGGRELAFRQRAKGVVWFDFEALCVQARSQVDYLEIASGYHTVLVSGVPQLQPAQTDVIRRLTWLVDVFYDQRVRLVMSAEVPPEDLVAPSAEVTGPGRMVRNEFARTASRLREMQSKDYFARKHASAENPQVLRAR
jgi:cell division protein ZapE